MIDRRALIIGCWLSKGESKLSNQKVISTTKHWNDIFKNKEYGFKSLINVNAIPKPLHNPTIAELTSQFEKADNLSNNTELLIYYLGDSVACDNNDIELSLGESKDGNRRSYKFSTFLGLIEILRKPDLKIILIIDTCHAGRTKDIFQNIKYEYFAMFASNSGYAFNANFSTGIFKAFIDPIQRHDQRINRRAGGVTYKKIFEYSTNYVLKQNAGNDYLQTPTCYGDYEGEILIEAPIIVPDNYINSISNRSIYARVYKLLVIFNRYEIYNIGNLHSHIKEDSCFLIKRDEEEGDQYISQKRIGDYIEFLLDIKWLGKDERSYRLTLAGSNALNLDTFNKLLLDGIESEVLPAGLNISDLENIVVSLLDDMIPPTPIKIQERTRMYGIRFDLKPGVRIALQTLPSTGRFLKSSADAIFPSDFL